MKQHTVTINGTVYDSTTGKALRVERGSDFAAQHNAHTVHTQLQKSKTLNRRYVQRSSHSHHAEQTLPQPAEPAKATTHTSPKKPNPAISSHRAPSMSDVKRSAHVTRFTPVSKQVEAKEVANDTKPTVHPVHQRAEERHAATKPVEKVVKPSHVIKREAIEQATAKMPAKHERHAAIPHKPKARSKFSRFVSVGSASLAILLLGAYLTYLNMPALSTRVAATQAGINASYPSYQPMGYSLSGPVAYKEGSVSMKFAANSGPESYTLEQTKSGWDSSAVLEYYVAPKAGNDYATTTANGLTIYTYGNTATWVNNGILYTIDGSAVLSNSQIQRIATSL